MRKRVISGTAGNEPIPGYVLRKRLGAGGYGEVWLADAPGGLRKAVKLIYGQVNEMRATSELRSLERIRRASHPFLLSIERIEVVHGKVIIVTELAESSLQDHFEIFRRQGAPGIPRRELLEFLRDAADALDFLAQKHSLQHLDVKPGNLLIIADRIKVADFGLVKDLQDVNQSLVGGLTPTYSAPELFDGRPNFRSDQYSLALVYMEMLTGKLPFRGATPGELARQHLTMAPDLDPLPPADRPAVMRALSKNPLDRYSSCRQFIDQLMKARSAVIPSSDIAENSDKSGALSTACAATSEAMTQCEPGKQHLVHPAIPLQDLASQWVQSRCLFIGLGGQGVQALQELRSDLEANVDDRFGLDDHQWLAIDTNCEGWRHSDEMTSSELFQGDCLFHLPIHSPHHYRRYPIERFAPLSRRWLYNIPRSLTTEGVRPIAMLSLLENYQQLRTVIENKLNRLLQQHLLERQGDSPLKIYCLASLHGGTGSGLLAEIGMIVRGAMQRLSFSDYRLSAAVSLASMAAGHNGPNLPVANAIATLSELSHWMNPSRVRPSIDCSSSLNTSNTCPFDWVTLIDGGSLQQPNDRMISSKRMARHVSLDCQSLVSAALSQSRSNSRETSEHGWLRSSISTSIQDLPDSSPETIAQWCCVHSLWSALSYLNGSSSSLNLKAGIELGRRSSSVNQLPLTEEACEEFTQRLLRDIGIATVAADAPLPDNWTAAWTSRLSDDPKTRCTQLGLDLCVWQKLIGHILVRQVYSWPYVQQINEKFTETLRRSISEPSSNLISSIICCSSSTISAAQVPGRVISYLSELSDTCQRIFASIHNEAEKLNQRYRHWWTNLGNDSQLIQLGKIDLLGLPEAIRQLASTTKKQLETQLTQPLTTVLQQEINRFIPHHQPVPMECQLSDPGVEILYSYSKMLLSAHESITALSGELGVCDDVFCRADYHYQSISMDELPQLEPAICPGGGEVFRIVIAPEQQMAYVTEAIESMGLRPQTTLLPATVSQSVQAVCDGVHLNVPYLISTLLHPSGATLDLAERLRTRIDIDWEPVSCLLEGHRTQPSPDREPSPIKEHVAKSPALVSGEFGPPPNLANFQS